MKIVWLIVLFIVTLPDLLAQHKIENSRFSYQRTQSVFGTIIDSKVDDLFYNGHESVYVMYAKQLTANPDTNVIVTGDVRIYVEPTDVGDENDFTIYKNYDTGAMVLRTIFANEKKCIVNDSIPALNWKLEPDKKRIGPYTCQKAITVFRCAKYTAWFTTAIPLPIGPAKLSGLPGLIVEATNERADITYTLLTVDYPTTAKAYFIAPPSTKDPVYSYANFRKIELLEAEKLRKFQAGTAENPRESEVITQEPECLTEP